MGCFLHSSPSYCQLHSWLHRHEVSTIRWEAVQTIWLVRSLLAVVSLGAVLVDVLGFVRAGTGLCRIVWNSHFGPFARLYYHDKEQIQSLVQQRPKEGGKNQKWRFDHQVSRMNGTRWMRCSGEWLERGRTRAWKGDEKGIWLYSLENAAIQRSFGGASGWRWSSTGRLSSGWKSSWSDSCMGKNTLFSSICAKIISFSILDIIKNIIINKRWTRVDGVVESICRHGWRQQWCNANVAPTNTGYTIRIAIWS